MNADPPAERGPTAGALIRPFLSAGVGADSDSATPSFTGPSSTGLRPFLLTAGRVTADVSIAIETQVISTELGRASVPTLAFERRDIVAICAEPLALAEIAAQLSLHLGVVRVLVGDLNAEGHLAVYLPNTDVSQDVDTLLRVIRGLRAIS
jgi:hypothetical protein